MLAFATRTWDGWDYIPNAWPVWLDAPDGALLVGCAAQTAAGLMGTDADGRPLTADVPIAISRVAMLTPTEGWVEGIRVDPRVRSMGVATDLQVAELHWLAANGAQVTRYATGERNEGSHRLGARHGFELAAVFRTWAWQDPDAPQSADQHDRRSAWDKAAQAEATERRRRALDAVASAGLTLAPTDARDWWQRVSEDRSFTAARGLYEVRGWTMQALTAERFQGHVDRGEVLIRDTAEGWALAILVGEAPPAEDMIIHLSLLVGDPATALGLASQTREKIREPLRFRLPQALAAEFPSDDAFAAEGFPARAWLQHILARDGGANALPPLDRARLILADSPRRVISPLSG